jgi:hypothetical protein
MDASNPSPARGKRPATRRTRRPGTETFWISLAAREDCLPFAEIRKGAVVPNSLGKVLAASWRELRRRHASVVPDAMAVGPHSLHGILFISHRGSENLSLADAVRLFKAISGRRLADLAKAPPEESDGAARAAGVWKKGYTERPLGGAKELASARKALKAGLGIHEAGVAGTRR